MHARFWLGLLALLPAAQAYLPRDCHYSMKCNDEKCRGTNVYETENGPSTMGVCTAGLCAGSECTPMCPDQDQTISCDRDDCVGFLKDGKNWQCTQRDYSGCGCSPVCKDDSPPKCSDDECKGVSNPNDGMGVCGLSKFTDCSCINSCPSEPPKCSDCGGINDPNGGRSVCLSGPNTGCDCTSSCPQLKCSDEGCEGFDNPNGNSACMAGPSAGCHCDAVCSDGLKCTDNECLGTQAGSNKGFCIAGAKRGCDCEPDCPSNKPNCSDCDGFNGACTGGHDVGCPCDGEQTFEKRQIKPRSRLTTEKPRVRHRQIDTPLYSVPQAYYVCGPYRNPNHPDPTVSYSRNEVGAALRRGVLALLDNGGVIGPSQQVYPRRFYNSGGNDGNWRIPAHVDQNNMFEFPIVRYDDGTYRDFGPGVDPGPDRVVFTGTGTFVGVFTHRGEVNNRFHQALGHTGPIFNPHVANAPFGPTGLDRDPLPWLAGGMMGSSGDLPFKRSLPPPKGSGDDDHGDECQMNQVSGDCKQATHPIKPPHSGPQTPICMKYDGAFHRIYERKAETGIASYCQNLVNDKIKLSKDHTLVKPSILEGGAEKDGDIAINVLWWEQACDQGQDVMDFGAITVDQCRENFGQLLYACGQSDDHVNPDFTQLGGSYGYSCVMWSVLGQDAGTHP